jgi:hypothetical protein
MGGATSATLATKAAANARSPATEAAATKGTAKAGFRADGRREVI